MCKLFTELQKNEKNKSAISLFHCNLYLTYTFWLKKRMNLSLTDLLIKWKSTQVRELFLQNNVTQVQVKQTKKKNCDKTTSRSYSSTSTWVNPKE